MIAITLVPVWAQIRVTLRGIGRFAGVPVTHWFYEALRNYNTATVLVLSHGVLLNFPVWQLSYPGGLLIAVVAIVHVLVSHFAVGGGAFLVLSENLAYRRNDVDLLTYVRRHSQFFALLTLVFGAVTGVGIWFTIGLVSPEATSSLIHTFVWGWAIEWVFFFVEIAAAIIYAKSWDVLDRRTHMIIGWIYFVAAWMSLFVINGILTYQLTPGRWLQTHDFLDGFFNPTYWPSLAARTALCILFAGLFGFVTLRREMNSTRILVSRWAGGWAISGAVLLPIYLWWYSAALPDFAKEYLDSAQFIAIRHGIRGGMYFAAAIVVITLICAFWKPSWLRAPVVALVILLALGLMGASEYTREFIRKPWVINGYMYANSVRVADMSKLDKDGVAAHAKFILSDSADSEKYGRDLFVMQCGACHSVNGYRGMAKRVVGWDAEFAAQMVAHIEKTKGTMAPFVGNEADRKAIGKYLASLNAPVQYPAITDANGVAVGERVFQVRCGSCHTINGSFRPLRGAFENSTPDQIEALLPMIEGMSPNMPKFTAPPDQATALAKYAVHEASKPLKVSHTTEEGR